MKKYFFFLYFSLSSSGYANDFNESLKSVCRPSFVHQDGSSHSAGTAFKVSMKDGRFLLLTANHLFGKDGGLKKAISPDKLPKKIIAVHCVTFAENEAILKAKNALFLSAVTKINAPIRLNKVVDIAAFRMPIMDKAPSMVFAETPPKNGDIVYLIAQVSGSSQYVHKAVVLNANSGTLMGFVYDAPNINLNATSGAPIVNENGEVVGVNFGGYSDNNVVIGISMSLKTIQQALASSK